MNKYIKCFSQDKADQLEEYGFIFLFVQNGIYWFENNEKLVKFNENDLLNDTKTTNTINF